ncbi:MAG: UDP-N-acetylmuramoyl-L-alanyl-D-glutamate--2,6-diaminopimelate ligase [Bacilli bacterium]
MKINKLINKKLINNHKINSLKTNSKYIKENDVFYAIKGSKFDGNIYIEDAIKAGAKTIISESYFNEKEKYKNINFEVVDDIRKTLAIHAKIFYNDISKRMTLIGITGTNGKTTITTLLYKYFQFLNKKATLVGTNGIYIMNKFYETKNTTPDILEIYEILKKSKESGVNVVFMEVSSHAVKMLRIYGLEFKIALITNLTQDHLDFHKTMEDYRYTKGLFLSSIEANNNAIINKDVEDYKFFSYLTKAKLSTFGINESNYQLINYKLSVEGSSFVVSINKKVYAFKTKLLGLFNIYNLLSFLSIIDIMGLFKKYRDKTIEFIASKINILGRMEVVNNKNRYFVIDFAHTPDGVNNVIDFLNSVKINNLYVVIGCGGDRDKSKRKVIGDIVSRKADFVFLTNDNPRTEDQLSIINDILEGVKTNNYVVILNRKMAIEEAYKRSLNGDIIAILGKGNEQYQIINNEKIKFSDKEIVQALV